MPAGAHDALLTLNADGCEIECQPVELKGLPRGSEKSWKRDRGKGWRRVEPALDPSDLSTFCVSANCLASWEPAKGTIVARTNDTCPSSAPHHLFFPVVISNRPWSLCSSFSCRIQDSSLSSSWNLRCKISYEWIKDRNNCKRNQNSFLECWNFEFKNLDDSERKLSLRELRYVENNGEQSSNLDSVFEEGDKFDADCSRVKMEIHSPTR